MKFKPQFLAKQIIFKDRWAFNLTTIEPATIRWSSIRPSDIISVQPMDPPLGTVFHTTPVTNSGADINVQALTEAYRQALGHVASEIYTTNSQRISNAAHEIARLVNSSGYSNNSAASRYDDLLNALRRQ